MNEVHFHTNILILNFCWVLVLELFSWFYILSQHREASKSTILCDLQRSRAKTKSKKIPPAAGSDSHFSFMNSVLAFFSRFAFFIHSLRIAREKIRSLTGDKKSTAVRLSNFTRQFGTEILFFESTKVSESKCLLEKRSKIGFLFV